MREIKESDKENVYKVSTMGDAVNRGDERLERERTPNMCNVC